jgi:glutamine synthetase
LECAFALGSQVDLWRRVSLTRCCPPLQFKGKDLLNGQTDGSSFPNGGLRATHTAGAYITVDPESPPFIMGDVMFIPSVVAAYTGVALDEKTPLHRSVQALSKQGARLLGLLGHKTAGLVNNIGLEQEIFLVPRDAYYKRPDLQFAGRTVLGRLPARGQEMSDHYMAPLSEATPALACMQEIQERCFKVGIPLKTRHREVAPNQFEFAPMFGTVVTQTDNNLVVMQIIEETAAKYGLAALLQEKPFQGVNGSGKHNNWSISTAEGVQLLNPAQLFAKTGSKDIFPVVMAALVSGLDKHGDLMRMAISSPGNDFRLGAMEAPPAVISTYLGDDMTAYLERFIGGASEAYVPKSKPLSFGVDAIRPIDIPAEDRNRTSPFPYGGARFEFRAVGSSQNVSLVNTVLATITADAFKTISDRVEKGENALAVARELLQTHFRVVFNGNGYDKSWPSEADKRGIWRIDSGVEATLRFTADKNKALFAGFGVFTAEECEARQEVLLKHYIGTVEVEAQCMVDMLHQHIIPDVKKADMADQVPALTAAAKKVKEGLAGVHSAADSAAAAKAARVLRLETMIEARKTVDAIEAMCPAEHWSLATYKDLLFLDSQPNSW